MLTVIDPGAGTPACRDVLLDADAGTTLRDVADDLRGSVGCADPEVGFGIDGRPLDPDLALGEPPLLHGAVLTLQRGGPHRMPLTSEAVVHVELVGGPGAGTVIPLGRGEHVVGRSGGCAVRLQDRRVSRHHLQLTVTSTGVVVRDLSPTNLSALNGTPLGRVCTPMRPGDRLRVGTTTLTHRLEPTTPAATTVADAARQVHRPPRFTSEPSAADIEFPTRPPKQERSRLPLIAALVPMLLSTVLAVVLHSPVMMIFALLTPAMLVGQWWSDRRHGRLSHRRRLAEHSRQRDQATRTLADALDREYRERHAEAPDLALVSSMVTGIGARLWERRPGDRDYLAVRLGVGPQQPRTRATGEPADLPALSALDVPVVVSLADVAVLGIAGPRERSLALAAGLVGQLCAWHSPRDLRLVVLTARSDGERAWGWSSLLPHLRPLESTCLAAIGDLSHEGTVGRRVAGLADVVARRQDVTPTRRVGPDVVVVLDGSERLRREPGVAELLREGPSARVHFVCLDQDPTRLPAEVTAQLVLDPGPAAHARLDVAGAGPAELVPDLPNQVWAEDLARALAPLEDATPLEESVTLPDHVDFVDVHRSDGTFVDPLDQADVARRWSVRGRSPMAMLGRGEDGPVIIDLVRDGPHALVGGTTGAGKSELLQTLVASLAVHSPPDELSFVLVDYKGGSAFRDCAGLPHVLGVVTDLDEHLTARALTSLGAELKRRERLLAEAGARSLEEYWRLAGQEHEPLARLVLVVDEFKVLAEELPDFVDGLVRLAAVGRSLGVHLVLATQRPAGIISADMRANISLRIALRVRDRSDSDDVIEAPDAAAISDRLPGRAYLRTGAMRLVPVQVAHAGAVPSARSEPPRSSPRVRPIDWGDRLQPAPRPPSVATVPSGPTALACVAETLIEAARMLGHDRSPSPWLPPLPDLLGAGDDRLRRDGLPAQAVPLGLVDRPAEQRQTALTWDVRRDGHLGLGGGARTGRTTTVVAVALRLAECFRPDELHMHALESSPGSLGCLSALPHCGSITGIDDVHRLRRAVQRLTDRQHPGKVLTVVLIDGWETIADALDDLDQGESTERLLGLVRDGLSRRVHVMVTGGRAVASGRLGGLLQRRLLLDMPDPVDLSLAGIGPEAAGRRRPPGRAIDVRDQAEVQLSLPGADLAAEPGLLARAVADDALARSGPTPESQRPWRLPPLPEHLSIEDLPSAPGRLLVGVGGDDLVPVGFDLGRDERRLLVLGPPRSGKSTLLETLATQLLSAGHEVAVIAPRRSPLARLPMRAGLHVLTPSDHDRFVGLRRERVGLAVLVDDCDGLDGTPLESALVEATRLVESAGGAVAVALDTRRAGSAFRGLVPEVSRAGVGVVLCPSAASDGDLLRVRAEPQPVWTPGRGVLVTDGLPTPVQVAVCADRQEPRQAQPCAGDAQAGPAGASSGTDSDGTAVSGSAACGTVGPAPG